MAIRLVQAGQETTDQLIEKVGDATIGDVGNKSKEEECPGHGIQQRFLDLVDLEVLVSDALLVDAHASDGEDTVLLLEPAAVQLAVGDNPEEDESKDHRKQTSDEEDNLPGRDSRSVSLSADRNAIGHEAAKDLSPAIETKPDVDSTALFLLGIPLMKYQQATEMQ